MNEREIFERAIAIDAEPDRRQFLEQQCGNDADLRQRLERLVEAHFRSHPQAVDKTAALYADDRKQPSGDNLPTTAEPGPQLEKGAMIGGRYLLLERVGEGGMGEVWVAEQKVPVKRKVAVKLIKAGMDSRAVLTRFEAERQALAVMDHVHIAKVLDGGTTPHGRPYFVMEFVKGVPLTDYCDQCKHTVHQRLELFNQVCSAVQHAHQKGIIHRDLKPSNILVTEYDGKPICKVIDFGLAKAVHGIHLLTDMSIHTAFGTVVGTPLYMAPEQLSASALDVDTRADLYSLGVILYELLTGTTPIERQRIKRAAWEEILRIVREEEPLIPSQRLSTSDTLPSVAACRHVEPARLTRLLRGDLDWIIMKALEKDRNRRYDTASSLALDIQRHLAGEAVLAAPPSRVYRIRKLVRKHRGAVIGASLISLTLITGMIGTSYGLYRANQFANAERRANREANVQRDLAEKQRNQADAQRIETAKAATRAIEESNRANLALAETEKSLAESRYSLASARWYQHRVQESLSLLLQIPQQFRNDEWYLDFERFQGTPATLYGHQGKVRRVAVSPDGTKAATGSSDTTIRIWSLTTCSELYRFTGHSTEIRDLCFGNGGTLVYSISSAGSIRCDNLETRESREIAKVLKGSDVIALSSNDKLLAFGTADGKVGVMNVSTGATERMLIGHTAHVSALSFHPDSTLLVSGSQDKSIRVWDLDTGMERAELLGHQDLVTDLHISPDGSRIASSSWDRSIRLWNLQTGLQTQLMRGHQSYVNCVAFNPDGRSIASAGVDQTIRIWDAQSGNQTSLLRGHQAHILDLAYVPSGDQLVSASADGMAKVYESRTLPPPPTSPGARFPIRGISISRSSDLLAYPTGDSEIRIIDLRSNRQIGKSIRQPGRVVATKFAGNGAKVLSALDDGSVHGWDSRTGEKVQTLQASESELLAVDVDYQGKLLAAGTADNMINILNLENGQLIHRFAGHSYRVCSVAFSPDARYLASGSFDQSVRLWDLQRQSELRAWPGLGAYTTSVAISPDGKYVAAGVAYTGTIFVWDLESGAEVCRLTGHTSSISAVSFNNDGSRLISSSWDGTVKFWDIVRAVEVCSLEEAAQFVLSTSLSTNSQFLIAQGLNFSINRWTLPRELSLQNLLVHSDWVTAVSFSTGGQWVVSGGWDRTVRLWDRKTASLVAVLNGHLREIVRVGFSADERFVISEGADGRKLIWETASQQPVIAEHWPANVEPVVSERFQDLFAFPCGRSVAVINEKAEPLASFSKGAMQGAWIDLDWHRQQAAIAFEASDLFAHLFHRAVILRAFKVRENVADFRSAWQLWSSRNRQADASESASWITNENLPLVIRQAIELANTLGFDDPLPP